MFPLYKITIIPCNFHSESTNRFSEVIRDKIKATSSK